MKEGDFVKRRHKIVSLLIAAAMVTPLALSNVNTVVTVIIGYILVSSGFCPKIVLEVPWTMPPVLFGFVATGGKPMGAVAQLIVVAVSVLVYVPFLIAYEKFQAKQAEAE